jgi:D-glycero-D-manno-heptose 1,7-bisphosphate phosphatase
VSEDLFEGFRLVIFDADDTLRRTTTPGKPCPHRPDEWELLPNVRDRLSSTRWGQAGGPCLGLASNQDQVGYGQLSMAMARRLLRDLAIAATGIAPPDPALQLCPHRLEVSCGCRKPNPGMLLSIMDYYGVQPERTVFVGNHDVDREAAGRAGVEFRWSETVFGRIGEAAAQSQ